MMRALIIEDELLAALHLEGELEAMQIQPIGIAVDRKEALAFVKENPDIAFVDVNLRDGATGPEIAAELSEANIGIIFLTANPSQIPSHIREGRQVLSKPLDLSQLIAAIARWKDAGSASVH